MKDFIVYGNLLTQHNWYKKVQINCFLGNERLHQLTKRGNYELRIDLKDFEYNSSYAAYDFIKVGDSASNFTLTIGAYHGSAGIYLEKIRRSQETKIVQSQYRQNRGQ